MQTIRVRDSEISTYQKGAWSLLSDIYYQSSKDIRGGSLQSFPKEQQNDNSITVFGTGFFNPSFVTTEPNKHEDLFDPNRISISERGCERSSNAVINSFNFVDHDTGVVGVSSAIGNNEKGIAGVAYGANLIYLKAWDADYLFPSGKENDISIDPDYKPYTDCLDIASNQQIDDSMAYYIYDSSIYYPSTKTILIESSNKSLTLEQVSDTVRAAISYATIVGKNIIVPAGNYYNKDVRNYDVSKEVFDYFDPFNNYAIHYKTVTNTIPTPDTGSIIVGGLTSNGINLAQQTGGATDGSTDYNYGRSDFDINTGYTNSFNTGHGIDISAPAMDIYTTSYRKLFDKSTTNTRIPASDNYTGIDGTSFSSPMVAGVISLMLAVNPDLKPDEIRAILRTTVKQKSGVITNNKLTAGCLDAYEAVNKVINDSKASGKYFQRFPNNPLPQTYTTYQTKSVPIVQPYGKTALSSGGMFALPINDQIKQDLGNVFVGGIKMKLIDIIQNYAIYGIPPEIANSTDLQNGIQSAIFTIFVRNKLDTANILTFEDALKITLDIISRINGKILVNLYYNQNIYSYDFDGKNLSNFTQITHYYGNNPSDSVLFPSWSPDGSKIAYWYYNPRGIAIINSDGTGKYEIPLPPNVEQTTFPSWSPDGNRIAHISKSYGRYGIDGHGYYVTIQNLDGTVVYEYPTYFCFSTPYFSPDGNSILTTEIPNQYTSRGIIVETDLNSGNRKILLDKSDAGSFLQAVYSHDGSKIAYIYNGSIYIMNRDGSNNAIVPYTYSADVVTKLEFLSNDKQILFTTYYGGLGVVNTDGTDFKILDYNYGYSLARFHSF